MRFKIYEKLVESDWIEIEFETLKEGDKYREQQDPNFEFIVLSTHEDAEGIFGVRVNGKYICE